MENIANHKTAGLIDRLAYTQDEVCRIGNFGPTTAWRLTNKGLLKRVPYVRRVLYTKDSVRAFFSGEAQAS